MTLNDVCFSRVKRTLKTAEQKISARVPLSQLSWKRLGLTSFFFLDPNCPQPEPPPQYFQRSAQRSDRVAAQGDGKRTHSPLRSDLFTDHPPGRATALHFRIPALALPSPRRSAAVLPPGMVCRSSQRR